ncbi:MAG: biotin--[Thermoguttaceae bacterium]|nr:biotin--[acetyl-CoA-carboxylase] ligase [Thermoguttaceae bacterium]
MLFSFQNLDSTNLEALRWSVINEASEDVWFTAEEQTGGLGQRNRTWISPVGGVYASVLYDPPLIISDLSHRGLITLAAGNAVFELIREIISEYSADVEPLKIHWPNDVYYDNRKLSGILTQSASRGKLVTGIGINANASISVSDANQPISLKEILQKEVNLSIIIDRLQKSWNDQIRQLALDVQNGSDDYVKQTEQKLAWLGKTVMVIQTDESQQPPVSGVLTGLTSMGALRIQTPDGERVLVSGSVRATST